MKKMLMLVVSMMFCVANMTAQTWPAIKLLSPTTSTSKTYNLRVGISSPSQIQSCYYSVNSTDWHDCSAVYRGLSAVANDGYSHMLSQTINLNYGNNTIGVIVKNGSVSFKKEFTVYVEQEDVPTASIRNVWLESNVVKDGEKGINIHVKFDVDNMKNLTGRCVVYFYNEDRSKMQYKRNGYKTSDGQACRGKDFTPIYESSTYSDLKIFVPYNALTFQYGRKTYYCDVCLYYHITSLASSEYYSFIVSPDDYHPSSAKRVALVIGNSNYKNDPLKNPVNDATDVATKLRILGFDVTLKTDLSFSGFENVLNDFQSKANNADVALLYYAGHGMEIGGKNYLIPVDAQLGIGDQLKYKSVDANYALDVISGASKKIIILDACRKPPVRSINDGGLAPMSAPNTCFAYSTSPGQSAPDGYGRNSPYTSSLLQVMDERGLTLHQLFQKVTRLVTAGNSGQIPWFSSSMVDDVILNR